MVFKIRFFDKPPFDGGGWAELIFGCRVAGGGIGFQIAATKVAVTAQSISMNAFYSRRFHHTFGGAAATLSTFKRVDLPNVIVGCNPA
jgi:hypothetical protein